MRKCVLIFLVSALTACQTASLLDEPGNRLPEAIFTPSTLSGKAPLEVTFDASASRDSDGSIAAYIWSFGDGSSGASGKTTTHTFSQVGTFTVTLTVTDNLGAQSSNQQVVRVSGSDANSPPVAVFSTSTTTGEAPLSVTFDASGSSDDGTIQSYAWNFGDGSSGAGVSTAHTFQTGTFTVTLTVTDNEGATAQQTSTITVTAPTDPNPPQNEIATLQQAWDASVRVENAPEELSRLALEVVLLASQQTGGTQVVVTGTVRETSPSVFTYEATPSDKLMLIRESGAQVEFIFSQLQGDFSGDAARFVNNDHIVAMQVKSNDRAGALDLTVQSQRLPRQGSSVRDMLRRVQGSFTDNASTRWTIDAQLQGASFYDVDSARLETQEVLSGNLSASEIGFSMTLNSTEAYTLLNTVENIRRSYVHSWQFGDSSYQLNSVEVFVAFKDNTPVDQDQWVIGGTLLKDGVVTGQVAQDTSDPSKFQVSLFIGANKVTLLSVNIF